MNVRVSACMEREGVDPAYGKEEKRWIGWGVRRALIDKNIYWHQNAFARFRFAQFDRVNKSIINAVWFAQWRGRPSART